jgi:hypothetical protein
MDVDNDDEGWRRGGDDDDDEEEEDEEDDEEEEEEQPEDLSMDLGGCGQPPPRPPRGIRPWMRRTFQQAMCERFLRGEDADVIDYAAIDSCTALDNMVVISREEEERYFNDDSGDDGSEALSRAQLSQSAAASLPSAGFRPRVPAPNAPSHLAAPAVSASPAAPGAAGEVVVGAGEEEVEDYMLFDLSNL